MQKGLNKQDKIKQAIKNARKENNLSFLLESYLEAFCKQVRDLQLNIDECDCFARWSDSDRFDTHIDMALGNLLCDKSHPNATQSALLDSLPHSLFARDEIAKKVVYSGYALVCDICCFDRIREELGFEALEKLFSTFYRIYILDLQSSIGMYGNPSIFILLPKCSHKRADSYLKDTLQEISLRIKNSKFVYENREIDIHITLLPIGDLYE